MRDDLGVVLPGALELDDTVDGHLSISHGSDEIEP